MSAEIVIERRFCGPPDSGHGGYSCGVVAARVDGPAEVTLRQPPPLDTPLAVAREDGGSVRVLHGEELVARGEPRDEHPSVDVPEPVSIAEAEAAGAASHLRQHPEDHPFPTCFVCGPQRAPGDGMRVMVGRVADREVAADVWTPATDLGDSSGAVRPEFVWAVLDCSGGVGSWLVPDRIDGNPFVLGRFAVRIPAPVRAGAPHAVIGWRVVVDGRKLTAGSALFTADGELAGVARATWIQLA
jgi:hypothetical protein